MLHYLRRDYYENEAHTFTSNKYYVKQQGSLTMKSENVHTHPQESPRDEIRPSTVSCCGRVVARPDGQGLT